MRRLPRLSLPGRVGLRQAALPAALLLVLAACGRAEVSPSLATLATASPRALPPPMATAADDNDITYACEGGLRFTATFRPSRSDVEIALPGAAPITLPQQVSGSGIRYADAVHELRGKGGDATWTVGRQAPLACRAQG
ncbi:MliC family protein [Roseomonas sp. OT10]|uniref:MliC family protein n=1 Tax=Roseomonas cutis TaxID=2897332 RepID=UPI001E584A92|nr:MliC family protein [Roseomonas sp. OT10]UFN50568.1 MliC family protein [Roseomonas sp. OT10]